MWNVCFYPFMLEEQTFVLKKETSSRSDPIHAVRAVVGLRNTYSQIPPGLISE